MTELHDLLHRATDRIDGPDLAARALTGARRRRARNRGVVAAVAAAAAVVAVVVSVELTTGGTRVDQPPVLSPSPGPTQAVATAPAIDPSRIQPVWDPRTVEGLPVTDLGVPRVMESLVPGVVTRPVAVLDDGERAFLVSADGLSDDLDLPDGLGEWRTVSLSPDGTRLAAVGISGFFWRALDGDWQRVDLEDGGLVNGELTRITWSPVDSSLVLREHLAGVQVDLDTGKQRLLPMLRNYAAWDFAPDGTVVTTSASSGSAGNAVRQWDGRDASSETLLGEIENLQRPVVGESSIMASRGDAGWSGGARTASDRDGLIAVDRDSLETRAFLPLGGPRAFYSDAGNSSGMAWLDDDTVAFAVQPKDAAKEYLVTWNVATGELSRISCWDTSFSAVFATELLK